MMRNFSTCYLFIILFGLIMMSIIRFKLVGVIEKHNEGGFYAIIIFH